MARGRRGWGDRSGRASSVASKRPTARPDLRASLAGTGGERRAAASRSSSAAAMRVGQPAR